MRFSEFIDVFVAALYNETELTGEANFRVKEILERYGLELRPAWRDRLFDDYAFSSRVETYRHIGPAEEQTVSLLSEGLRWVEDELGENVAEYLERSGAHYAGKKLELTAESLPRAIQSADWTGIAARIGPAQKQKISSLSDALKRAIEQSDLDQRSMQNAIAHVEAVERLTEAPDPPWRLVVELLAHPVLQAFVTTIQIAQIILEAGA